MSVTRVPQFPESVIRRGQAEARNDLDVYSRSETIAAIPEVDLSAYTPLSTTASISGALNIDITTLETTTANISGDVYDLDLSMTQAVFTHINPDGTSPSVSGSMYAWGKVTAISGGPFWIQLFK